MKKVLYNKGLTLLELLGAIAVIMVMVSIVTYSIRGVVDSGKETATLAQVRTLNFALEQARIRKDDPILRTGNKWEVYDYLKQNGFLVGGE